MTRAAIPPLALLLMCTAATTPARGGGPTAAPAEPSGRELFRAECGGCHLENGFGTRVLARRVPPGQALLEQREGLDGEFVKFVVRHGLGSMPQIRRTELGDGDLALIVRYLKDEE